MTDQHDTTGQPQTAGRAPFRERHRTVLAVLIVLAAIAALGAVKEVITSHPAATPAPARVVATFSGSGQENTPRFTTGTTWALRYSFDCSGFGEGTGNFQVLEDGSAVMVNDLAAGKSAATYAYDDAGTHYLEVVSECSWTATVVG